MKTPRKQLSIHAEFYIAALCKASGPVSLSQITDELFTQISGWESLAPLEQDIAVEDALSALVRQGLRINVDVLGGEITFG